MSGEYVWGWILRVWDNGRRNINSDWICKGLLRRHSRFSIETHTVKEKVPKVIWFVGWSVYERMANEKGVGVADIPWLGVGGWILRLGDIRVLEWIRHLKSNPPQWDGTMQKTCPSLMLWGGKWEGHQHVWRALPSLCLCQTSGWQTPLFNWTNVLVLIEPRVAGTRWQHQMPKVRQTQHRQCNISNGITCMDLWYCLTNIVFQRMT